MPRLLKRTRGTVNGETVVRTFKEDLLPDELNDIVEIDHHFDQWIFDNWEKYYIGLNRPYVITNSGLITKIWI